MIGFRPLSTSFRICDDHFVQQVLSSKDTLCEACANHFAE